MTGLIARLMAERAECHIEDVIGSIDKNRDDELHCFGHSGN